MSRLVKFLWFFSMLIFLIALLYVYAYMPGMVGIHAGPQGDADQFINRSTFFYVSIGIFLIANIAFYVLKKLLEEMWLRSSSSALVSPARMKRRADVADWLLGFAAALNFFFVLILIYLAMFNNSEDMSQGIYAPLVYGGPIMMGILFIILIFIFTKKRAVE